MKPIDIAGGGLAGLSLGIALRRAGVPVTVWEAGSYPRHRVCGEFICGVSAETLEELGIADLFAGAAPVRSATWHHRNTAIFDVALPIEGRGLSRFTLDDRLAHRFRELGGNLQTGQRRRDKNPEGAVWATGRVAAPSHLLGLKMHLLGFEMSTDLEMHFAPGGYAGVSWVEDGRVNLCALFRQRPELRAPKEELMLAYLSACGFHDLVTRVRAAKIDPASHAAVSSVPSGFQRATRADEACAVGDFYGMVGPFTGNGISMAFESALAARDPLARYARGECDWPGATYAVLAAQEARFGSRLKLSQYVHEMLLNPVGLSGLAMLSRARALPFGFLFNRLR